MNIPRNPYLSLGKGSNKTVVPQSQKGSGQQSCQKVQAHQAIKVQSQGTGHGAMESYVAQRRGQVVKRG